MLFLGIALTGFGLSYYHWDPNDRTLFWDRLPMALSFMAILAIVIEERIDATAGAKLLWPFVAIGVISLLLWRWTGYLRLYVWVQFFPMLSRWPYSCSVFRHYTQAHLTGSSLRRYMRWPSCSNSMIAQSTRWDQS